MPLTDIEVRRAKAREKAYRMADERGMYVEVTVTGAKYWRMKYRYLGKERLLALGVYPEVGLKDAREKRDAARKLLAAGTDPMEAKKARKIANTILTTSSFESVAREWFAKFAPGWAVSHASKIIRRLERDVFPWLGNKPVSEITAPELLTVLRRVENRGAVETAHRIHQNCSQVFRYAIATGRADRDPAPDLRGAIPPSKERHHASLTNTNDVAILLRVIEGYSGTLITKCALQLAPLVFVRPGELRKAEWSEINLVACEWRIPAEKMKMKAVHIVPLSKQAISILAQLQPLTGKGKYVFPGARSSARPMSENTVNAALRRLGYGTDDMTGHGFRSMASTLLNEQGWNRDAIERQLAHAERDSIRAAYNYAEHLPERRRMMQSWADYLQQLCNANVLKVDFPVEASTRHSQNA